VSLYRWVRRIIHFVSLGTRHMEQNLTTQDSSMRPSPNLVEKEQSSIESTSSFIASFVTVTPFLDFVCCPKSGTL